VKARIIQRYSKQSTYSEAQENPMTTKNYQKIKRTLYKLSILEGYLDATWKTHTIVIDPTAYTATITLTLDTGHQYKVGHIHFIGTSLQEKCLKRYITFTEGGIIDLIIFYNLKHTQ